MTNEEAIRCLSVHSSTNGSGLCTDEQHYEAKQMAIKALEQQPCDDAVSREAVKKWICKTCPDDSECQRDCDVIKGIDTLPPVTPQQKYGKWIEHPEIETIAPEYLMFYECSECGNKPCFGKSDIHKKRFCSNCGAKMESEVEE